MKTRSKLASLLTIAGLTATAGLVGAQTPVDVEGTVGVSSRELFVQDLLGVDLTTFDFGTGGSIPFQVRVEDDAFTPSAFSVDATMTNLYVDTGAALDFTKVIPSENVSVAPLTAPLSVENIVATVEPVFDTVTTINDAALCTLLLQPGLTCTLAANAVEGVQQELTYGAEQLDDLAKLPIVPQQADTGAFLLPAFEGDTATAPAAENAPAATPLQMIGGTLIAPGNLDVLSTLLDTELGATTSLDRAARGAIIDESDFTVAVQNAVTGLIGSVLDAVQLNTVLNSASTLTRNAVAVNQIVSQTGAYRSFPILELDIPAGSDPGNYRGSLVVTDIQP